MNPYSGQTFWGFFLTLVEQFPFFRPLYSDELQLLILTFTAASCTLLGTFLVVKKMTMIANSLSHTLLMGIAAVFLIFGSLPDFPLIMASIIMSFTTVILTRFFMFYFGLREDRAIGFIFNLLFALGIILITALTRSAHIGLEAVMGNIDALHPDDLFATAFAFLLNGAVIFLFYKEFKMIAFDPEFARVSGYKIEKYDGLFLILSSITLIANFRIAGVLMVLAFLTAPVLSARLVFSRIGPILAYSTFLGVLASWMGVALSRHILTVYEMPVSTSGLTVFIMTVIFLAHFICFSYKKKTRTDKETAEKCPAYG